MTGRVRPRSAGTCYTPNIASFLLALAVLYLEYRPLFGLDWGEARASVQRADAWLFALAFAVFYAAFFLRALRWKALLATFMQRPGQVLLTWGAF